MVGDARFNPILKGKSGFVFSQKGRCMHIGFLSAMELMLTERDFKNWQPFDDPALRISTELLYTRGESNNWAKESNCFW